jgi:hypothetical protein
MTTINIDSGSQKKKQRKGSILDLNMNHIPTESH